jgi:hypothetical protein
MRPAPNWLRFATSNSTPVLLPAACPRSYSLPRVPPSNWLRSATSGSTRFCSLPHAHGPALCRASRPQIGFVSQLPAPPGLALSRTPPVLLSTVRPAPNWLRFATSGSTRFCSPLHVPGRAPCHAPSAKLASFRNFRLQHAARPPQERRHSGEQDRGRVESRDRSVRAAHGPNWAPRRLGNRLVSPQFLRRV